MANNWVKVYTAFNPIEAEIVIAMLHENGIEAVEMNKRDSSYLAFGGVEVYCQAENVVTALHLIQHEDKQQD
jgi:type III secretory pathway lipoprotein EscJ